MYIKTMADAYKGDNFENTIEIHSNWTNNQGSPRTFLTWLLLTMISAYGDPTQNDRQLRTFGRN